MDEETYQQLFVLMSICHSTLEVTKSKLVDTMTSSGVLEDSDVSAKFPELMVKKTRDRTIRQIRKISTDMVDLAGSLNELCDTIEVKLEGKANE